MPRPNEQKHGGFSLIEVVVALVIVALTLGTVLRLVSGAMLGVGRAENYLYALSAAQSQLAEIAARSKLQPGESQGTRDGVAWQLSVAPFAAPRPTAGSALYHVVVSTAYRGSKVALETLLIGSGAP